jgi:uncharacterized protein with PQ loop repeat
MNLYEYFAYIGAMMFALHMIPQIIKISKTKSANDFSYLCLFLNIVSMCLLSIYGYTLNDKSLYLTTGISFVNTVFVVLLKFYYDKFEQYDIDTAI